MKTRDEAYKAIGADLRRMREEAALSLESVGSDVLGVNRDAMSKYERGERPIPMFDYLVLLNFYRDIAGPDHPGVKASARYLK